MKTKAIKGFGLLLAILVAMTINTVPDGYAKASNNGKGKGSEKNQVSVPKNNRQSNGQAKKEAKLQSNVGVQAAKKVQPTVNGNVQMKAQKATLKGKGTQASAEETGKIVQAVKDARRAKIHAVQARNEHGKMVSSLVKTLKELDMSRGLWANNPHNNRGQGNMGIVTMLDPYGHDKESDRKELFGNRGRPTSMVEPVPGPEPQPEPEPVIEPEPQPEPEPVIEPEPQPEPEPVIEPEPQPDPVIEPEPQPEPEPVIEPEPQPDPVIEPEPEPEPVIEPEPQPEPVPEPEPIPEPEIPFP